MASPRLLWPLVGLLTLACDGTWLAEGRVIRELSPEQAARLLRDPEVQLFQVWEPRGSGARVEGSELWAAGDPVPREGGPSRIIVVAEDPASGLAAAARLARSGIPSVAVVRGGVAAWQAQHRTQGTDVAAPPREPT